MGVTVFTVGHSTRPLEELIGLLWEAGVASDALVARGHRVVHLLGPGQQREHSLSGFARLRRGRLTYPLHEEEGPRRRSGTAGGGRRLRSRVA